MGIFFYTNSVAFIEDVPLDVTIQYQNQDELTNDIEAGFQQVRNTSQFMINKIGFYRPHCLSRLTLTDPPTTRWLFNLPAPAHPPQEFIEGEVEPVSVETCRRFPDGFSLPDEAFPVRGDTPLGKGWDGPAGAPEVFKIDLFVRWPNKEDQKP